MSYRVMITKTKGAASFRRRSSIAALEKAIELIGRGAKDVQITDATGRKYAPSSFIKAHVERELSLL